MGTGALLNFSGNESADPRIKNGVKITQTHVLESPCHSLKLNPNQIIKNHVNGSWNGRYMWNGRHILESPLPANLTLETTLSASYAAHTDRRQLQRCAPLSSTTAWMRYCEGSQWNNSLLAPLSKVYWVKVTSKLVYWTTMYKIPNTRIRNKYYSTLQLTKFHNIRVS